MDFYGGEIAFRYKDTIGRRLPYSADDWCDGGVF